ncbi:MAG: AraC family transcriptional regulator [Pseudomonadota bacterium]
MAKHVVPASILQNLIEIALRSRLNLEELFGEAEIDPDMVGRQDALVDVDSIDRLFSLAFARVEDPWFGLHVGLSNQYTSLDLLGRLMATSSTLRDAVDELLRFKDLLAPFLRFELCEQGGVAILAVTPDGSVKFTESRHHNDLVVATIFNIGRSLAGGDLGVRKIVLRHAQPADMTEYRKAFGDVPMAFGSPCNEVHFDAELLDRRLSTAYPRYHQRVEQLAEQQLSRLARGHRMSEQVMVLLEQRLGEQTVGIDDIARLFNMTARTLQRRLRDESVTFGDLRDQVRHRVACRLLGQPEIDMDTLAQRLGFSDTANFYHAFRRWEGRTPGAYRKALSEPGPS